MANKSLTRVEAVLAELARDVGNYESVDELLAVIENPKWNGLVWSGVRLEVAEVWGDLPLSAKLTAFILAWDIVLER